MRPSLIVLPIVLLLGCSPVRVALRQQVTLTDGVPFTAMVELQARAHYNFWELTVGAQAETADAMERASGDRVTVQIENLDYGVGLINAASQSGRFVIPPQRHATIFDGTVYSFYLHGQRADGNISWFRAPDGASRIRLTVTASIESGAIYPVLLKVEQRTGSL